jgi:hypothetical protein
MDFLAICQGLGLAIAAGLFIGVVVPPIMPGWGVIAGAAPLGVLACAAALTGEDEAIWPALPVGVIGAGLAASVTREVAAGAVRREQGTTLETTAAQAPSGVTAIVALAAILVAVLSLFVPPVSLVALAALAWIWLSRRRSTDQKHEGLRVLR